MDSRAKPIRLSVAGSGTSPPLELAPLDEDDEPLEEPPLLVEPPDDVLPPVLLPPVLPPDEDPPLLLEVSPPLEAVVPPEDDELTNPPPPPGREKALIRPGSTTRAVGVEPGDVSGVKMNGVPAEGRAPEAGTNLSNNPNWSLVLRGLQKVLWRDESEASMTRLALERKRSPGELGLAAAKRLTFFFGDFTPRARTTGFLWGFLRARCAERFLGLGDFWGNACDDESIGSHNSSAHDGPETHKKAPATALQKIAFKLNRDIMKNPLNVFFACP